MMDNGIPEEEQISAALSGSLWTCKLRYCDGESLTLQSMWTVSFDQILVAARQRGLEHFVQESAGGHGVFLMKHDLGYEVRYMERNASIFGERFEQLEPAFCRWLHQSLHEFGLLSKAGL